MDVNVIRSKSNISCIRNVIRIYCFYEGKSINNIIRSNCYRIYRLIKIIIRIKRK